MINKLIAYFLIPLKQLRGKFLSPNQEKLNLIQEKLNLIQEKLNLIQEKLNINENHLKQVIPQIDSLTKTIAEINIYQKINLLPEYYRTKYFKGQLQTDEVDTALKICAVQDDYKYILNKLRLVIGIGKKVRIAFFVVFDSVFPSKPLFEKMLEDDFFAPFIVVIPDTLRGEEHMLSTLNKTYSVLSTRYQNVYMSYDFEKNEFINFSNEIDIVCTSNPYDSMTHEYYSLNFIVRQGVLPIYISYAYLSFNFSRYVISLESMCMMWKIFVESEGIFLEYINIHENYNNRIVLTGYCKMDSLEKVKKLQLARKKIIIAPHHTITYMEGHFNLSNFLTYADFFLELPKLYPNIDFIIRPHPLLFSKLCKENIWGKEKTEKYFRLFQSYPNAIYDTSDDYFDTFMNSDGIIHDCGSFLAEYIYTEHPACYLLKNEEPLNEIFMEHGRTILQHYYKAFSKEDILDFINNVIIQGDDYLKMERIKFLNNHLKLNYPNVAAHIIKYLKNELMSKKEI